MKMFNTNSREIIRLCQEHFYFKLPSNLLTALTCSSTVYCKNIRNTDAEKVQNNCNIRTGGEGRAAPSPRTPFPRSVFDPSALPPPIKKNPGRAVGDRDMMWTSNRSCPRSSTVTLH